MSCKCTGTGVGLEAIAVLRNLLVAVQYWRVCQVEWWASVVNAGSCLASSVVAHKLYSAAALAIGVLATASELIQL